MSQGIPLSDEDRAPWLDALAHAINQQTSPHVIVACSALTQFARQRLLETVQRPISFIHLRASPGVLTQRLQQRHHFMKDELLASQLATLETPRHAVEIDADDSIEVVTARVIACMRTLAGTCEPHH
jgi:carbohydrate kinase (thermoresistant glucokinase family)